MSGDKMDDTVSLRCKFCGAPFDTGSLKADATYVTCGSCGTSQTRVDAKEYLDQMMGQVQAWISKAIPTGVSIANADNIDAVARHNIFSNSVRPAMDTQMTEMRFGFLSLLSNQLIIMPFRTSTSFRPSHKTENAFEFNAKAKAVAPLAVDTDSIAMMKNADKMSLAYAMMLNNMKQLAEDKPDRYTILANNFSEAADSLKGLDSYVPVMERMDALSRISKGFAFLLDGNTIEAKPEMDAGIAMLESAKQKTMTSMEFGSTYLAVEQEGTIAKVLMNIVDSAQYDPSINTLQILDMLKKVMDVASVVYSKVSGAEGAMFKNLNRYNEIFSDISKIIANKAGKGAGVNITAGSGSALLPFWSVSLRYSFTTGTFLNKKSVEVTESLLLPATFVTDAGSFSNPRAYVTDIFSSRPGGFFDSLKGSEKSMSESGEIGNLVKSVAENSVGTRRIVVPVSTKSEAESFVLKYLKQCTADDNKLKLIKPTVDKLIYVPCEIADSVPSFPSLGKVAPKSVGNMGLIQTLLI